MTFGAIVFTFLMAILVVGLVIVVSIVVNEITLRGLDMTTLSERTKRALGTILSVTIVFTLGEFITSFLAEEPQEI